MRAKDRLAPLRYGQAREVWADAIEHESRRVLDDRRQDAGRRQHDDGWDQPSRSVEADGLEQECRVCMALERPCARIVDQAMQRGIEVCDAADEKEAGDD